MKHFTLSFLLLITLLSFKTESNAAGCNWKSRITAFTTWDSCTGTKASLNGYITLNTKGCFIYQWKVGSANVGTNYPAINYKITGNGTYTLCVKVTDTCNKCDTTLCSTFTITCFSSCNWKGKSPGFTAWDTCKGAGLRNSLNGYIVFKSPPSCLKYNWTVNGNAVGTNSQTLNYSISNNGTYTVCVKVTDTCKKCDTTFCSTRTITCFTSPCDWKKYVGVSYNNNCFNNKDTLKAYLYTQSKISCPKIIWTLNGNTIATNVTSIKYPVLNNGSYQLCVKVTDTCNKCDTIICKSFTVSCLQGSCSWYTKSPNMTFWDTCKGQGGVNSTTGYIGLNSRTCQKYIWTVNGITQSTKNYYIHYPITANGTYTICVKVIDTCNNCDTTFCTTRTFTCFPSCNWKSKISNFYAWDTCKGSTGRNSLNAYIAFNSSSGCYKYQWTVNKANAGNGNIMHYNIANNGTYTVCVKVTDTCNHCDTTICSTRTITCFGTSTCNWKNRTPYFYAWDTCTGSGTSNSINAYMSFKSFYCLKYVWTVNGVAQNSKTNILNYPIKSNGTYVVCVKVIDTCSHCDTTICSTRSITCFNTSKCIWKSKISNFYTWDTCKGTGSRNSLNGYLALKTTGCFKYQWKVNNNLAGTSSIMSYKITGNGTYTICVKVTDTCNHCDTVLCTTKTITCFTKPCNFKARGPNFITWDSCVGSYAAALGYVSFTNSKCLKYAWTLAGVAAGTGPAFVAPIYKNGTYVICVKVTDTCNSSRCDTTLCYTRTISCSGLGINNDASFIDNIRIYPNPVQQVLSIDWTGEKAAVEVLNILGEQVYNGELRTDKNSIQTETWSNGIYIVRVKTDTGSRNFKIVVNR